MSLELLRSLTLPDGRRWGDAEGSDGWLERDVLGPIVAQDDAGMPLHRQCWIELARGHAKTSSVAGVALVEALAHPGTQVYCLAADTEQAQLIIQACAGQCRRNPGLAAAFKQSAMRYTVKSNGSFIQVVSSDVPSFFGIAPDARRLRIIADELTQWRLPDLWHAIQSTMPKVRDSQLVVITNAGVKGSWQEEARTNMVESGGYLYAPTGIVASWIREEDVARARHNLPPGAFTRYWQNEWVLASEDAIFKPEWMRSYDELPADPRAVILTADTAFEAKRTADYSVILALAVGPDGYYLADCYREKVEFPELKAAMVAMAEAYPPGAVVVEDAASGRSLRQEMERSTRLPIIGRRPLGDKVSRAFSTTATFEAGRVFFPRRAAWLQDVLAELLAFPSALHDDFVDALVQGINYLNSAGYAFDKASGGIARASVVEAVGRSAPLRAMRPALLGGSSRRINHDRDARQADTVLRIS